MNFGRHLQALPGAAGLSRRELGRRASIPASTLRNWESDRACPVCLPSSGWPARWACRWSDSRPSNSPTPGASHRGTLLTLLGVTALLVGVILLDPAAGWLIGFLMLLAEIRACLALEGRWHGERDEGGRRGGNVTCAGLLHR
jgi:hypothetical protein